MTKTMNNFNLALQKEFNDFRFARNGLALNQTSGDINPHKMPYILASKNYNKFKKLHHIKNIYIGKDIPCNPLTVKFERLGRKLD